MGVAVPCLVVFAIRFWYCLGKNDFLSMILFLIKILFYYFSNSLIFLVEMVAEAIKVQNNESGILFKVRWQKCLNTSCEKVWYISVSWFLFECFCL